MHIEGGSPCEYPHTRPPERLIYDAQACWLSPEDYEKDESWIEQQLLAFKASTDPDTMYYHQAMKEPDKEQFLTAIDKECEAHFKEGNYVVYLYPQVAIL